MSLYKREFYLSRIRKFYHNTELVKILTGVRQSGKSSLMEMIRQELLEQGIATENILSLNLESRKYRKIKTPDALEDAIETLGGTDGLRYLLIDAVQNIEDYEEVINAFRLEGNYSVFVANSGSHLRGADAGTNLSGRYLEFEIFPLNFEEYLGMKAFYNKPTNPNYMIEFQRYLQEGGFPGAVAYDAPEEKRMYVKSVIEEIFEKDIRRYAKVRTTEMFDIVRGFLIRSFGEPMSILGMQEALAQEGIRIKRDTLRRYADLLVGAKLLYSCERCDLKTKVELSGERRYYLGDPAFYFALSTDERINYEPMLENIVYLYAKSRGYYVNASRNGRSECDFILRDDERNYRYVQVAYSIIGNRENEDAEYEPLERIKDNYPKYVVTMDCLLQKRSGIHHINLMEFMMEGRQF